MRAVILASLLIVLLLCTPAAAEVVVLPDPTAEAVANALQEAKRLAAELELTQAKLAAADERNANLVAQVQAMQAQMESLAQRVGDLQSAVARNVAADARLLTTLDETQRTLEASRRALEAANKPRSGWSYVLDGLRILGAILPFLLIAR